MQRIDFKEKSVEVAIFQFIFPFSFKEGIEQKIFPFLLEQQFKHFKLDHLDYEDAFYGDYCVSHREMEAYYLPFTNQILFPYTEHQKGFQRYSKALKINANLTTEFVSIPFQVHSIDVLLCPYELGFLTIRTEVKKTNDLTLSDAIEFASRFRVLEPKKVKDSKTTIESDGENYNQVKNFIFHKLFKGMTEFFEKKNIKNAYFERFPFFEDERMYVQSLISLREGETIDLADVYRSGSFSGLSLDGKPFISANNLPYISKYLEEHGFFRWAPDTYFSMEEHSFTCITNENSKMTAILASQIYGELYYGVVLNFFHKIVLLKMAYEYSELNIERDTKEIEKLIYSINAFTANYFFLELASQSQGRDIFEHLRKSFNIELLYSDAKQTLHSLIKYQENTNAKKDSLLLLVLTLYSVIGQMFGMNLVTSDFVGKIKWKHMLSYNPLEYLALFVACTGVVISLGLGIQSIYQWIKDRKNRKKWFQQTVLSSTKEK